MIDKPRGFEQRLNSLYQELEKGKDANISDFGIEIIKICHDVDNKRASAKELDCVQLLRDYLHVHEGVFPKSVDSDTVANRILGAHISDLPEGVMGKIITMLPFVKNWFGKATSNKNVFARVSHWARSSVKDAEEKKWADRLNELKDLQELFIGTLKSLPPEKDEGIEQALEMLRRPLSPAKEGSAYRSKPAEELHSHILKALAHINRDTIHTLVKELSNPQRKNSHISIFYDKQNWISDWFLYGQAFGNSTEKDDVLFHAAVKNALNNRFNVALDLANQITNSELQGEALRDITLKLVKNDELERAVDIARSISDKSMRSFSLDKTAIAMAQKGRFKELEIILNQINNDDELDRALDAIETNMIEQGNEDGLIALRGIYQRLGRDLSSDEELRGP